MASTTADRNLASPFSYPLSQTALLLLDYSSVIVNLIQPTSRQESLLAAAQKLLKWARDNNILIVHCLIDFSELPESTSKVAGARYEQYQKLFSVNPDLANEHPSLRAPDQADNGGNSSENEITIKRQPGRVSALKSPGLLDMLKQQRDIKNLVMAGLVSSGCTLTTARAATDEGFVVTVVEDACGDRTEKTHGVVMEDILPMTVTVLRAEEWIKGMTMEG